MIMNLNEREVQLLTQILTMEYSALLAFWLDVDEAEIDPEVRERERALYNLIEKLYGRGNNEETV